jgi:hypothetical protein
MMQRCQIVSSQIATERDKMRDIFGFSQHRHFIRYKLKKKEYY